MWKVENFTSEVATLAMIARIGEREVYNGTTTKQWVWSGNEMREEQNASNGVTKRFFHQGEQINGNLYFYTLDHLGSIRELADNTGVIQARYSYNSYGNATKVSGPMDSDFQYTGYFIHQPTGLNFTLYRIYDSTIGRWFSRDPLPNAEVREGINLYSYVRNNPIDFTDPDGDEVYKYCVDVAEIDTDSKIPDARFIIVGLIYVNQYPVIRRKCLFRCYHKKTKNCPYIPCFNPWCTLDHGVSVLITVHSIGNVPCAVCESLLAEVTAGKLTGGSVARNAGVP